MVDSKTSMDRKCEGELLFALIEASREAHESCVPLGTLEHSGQDSRFQIRVARICALLDIVGSPINQLLHTFLDILVLESGLLIRLDVPQSGPVSY